MLALWPLRILFKKKTIMDEKIEWLIDEKSFASSQPVAYTLD